MLRHIYHCIRAEMEFSIRSLRQDHHARTTVPGVVLPSTETVLPPQEVPIPSIPVQRNEAVIPSGSVKEGFGDGKAEVVPVIPLPDLRGSSLPDLRGSSLPDLRGSSLPDLRGSSLPDLRGSSLPDLRGSSLPDLRGTLPNPQGVSVPNLRGTPVPDVKATPLSDLKGSLPSNPRGTPLPRSQPAQSKLILIIDLDMTLVHAIHEDEAIARFNNWLYGASRSAEEDQWKQTLRPQLHSFELMYIDDEGTQRVSHLLMKVRPGVQFLLRTLAASYEMIVYTQGEDQYAEKVMEFIDPDKCVRRG